MEQQAGQWDVRLDGQVAVVTGGSGVLGRVMAHGLGAAGARVAVLGRRSAVCEAVAREITAAGGVALGLACDVRDRASIVAAHERIASDLGPGTILVNAAGGNAAEATTTPEQTFFDLDEQALDGVLRLNLGGTFTCCQIFGRSMAERGSGTILNIASMNALRPLTRIPAYSAAKAGVVNFTQWLAAHMAQEYSPHIRVNALAPGFFLTEQNRFLLTDPVTGAQTPRGAAILAHTPMGRFGAPEDLVGPLLWLVSPAAAFVTGIVVPVDGGFSAYSGV